MPLRPENTADSSYEKPGSITSWAPRAPQQVESVQQTLPEKKHREKPQGPQINK